MGTKLGRKEEEDQLMKPITSLSRRQHPPYRIRTTACETAEV